ncbi:MAG: hypothetical protein WA484_04780 [Solirubrobacteraceae bacterium]
MKLSLVLTTVPVLGLGVCACGSATGGMGSTSEASSASQALSNVVKMVSDGQTIELEVPNPREDRGDDMTIYAYGRVSSGHERQAITAVVNRYYAAAAAGDSAAVCSLTLSSLARSLPEDYGAGAGPSYLRGSKTCHAVMSKIFKHFHAELTGKTEVTNVRVEGNQAIAFLRSRGLMWVGVLGRKWALT